MERRRDPDSPDLDAIAQIFSSAKSFGPILATAKIFPVKITRKILPSCFRWNSDNYSAPGKKSSVAPFFRFELSVLSLPGKNLRRLGGNAENSLSYRPLRRNYAIFTLIVFVYVVYKFPFGTR